MSCHSHAGDRAFVQSPLLQRSDLGSGIFVQEYAWTGGAPKPGQFFLMRASRGAVLLGRPISVYAWNEGAKTVSFLIAGRGRGTEELESLQVGDKADLIGPLGNSWEQAGREGDAAYAVSAQVPARDPAKPIALVGGGIGVAPLSFYASTLRPESYDYYAGFRSSSYGLEGLLPQKLLIASEDGCEGKMGRIPDYLDTAAYGAVYACGPEPMLRAVAAACKISETSCFISLETRMACGVGACLGCTVRTRKGNKRCCVEGPVFAAQELIFDE